MKIIDYILKTLRVWGIGIFISSVCLIVTWVIWGWKIGLLSGTLVLAISFLIGFYYFTTIPKEEIDKWAALAPLFGGGAYMVIPDLPLPADDIFMYLVGLGTSYFVAVKRWGVKETVRCLSKNLIVAFYPLVGFFIPGMLDEVLVLSINLYDTYNKFNTLELQSTRHQKKHSQFKNSKYLQPKQIN